MASLTASLRGAPRLTRWGGIAALLGGALTAALILFPVVHIGGLGSSPPGEYLHVFLASLATLLLAGGLVGLHVRQAGAHGYGWLGGVGFLLAFAATLAVAVLFAAAWFVAEASAKGASAAEPALGGMAAVGLAGLAQSVGLVLLGVATLRARVLPLPRGALLLAVVLLEALSTYVTTPAYLALGGRNLESPVLKVMPLLGSLCWGLLGYALLSGRGERGGRPASVR